jgi:broad specificity phosphatase PhoE
VSIELRRHTANDGDALTPDGVAAALATGRELAGGYDVIVSTGAQRATQTAACLIAASGLHVPQGIVVDEGFRSPDQDHWREIYAETGSGELVSFLDADLAFVEAEAARFAEALSRTVECLPDGGRAMVVGHSPMLEAAVWAVTGAFVGPLGKGEAVLLLYADGEFGLA